MTAVLGGEGPGLNFEPTIEFDYDRTSSDPYAVAELVSEDAVRFLNACMHAAVHRAHADHDLSQNARK